MKHPFQATLVVFPPSSPVQFSSLHIATVIFVFPLSKVVDGAKRTAPYVPFFRYSSVEVCSTLNRSQKVELETLQSADWLKGSSLYMQK